MNETTSNPKLAIVLAHNEAEAIRSTIATIRRWAPESDVLVARDSMHRMPRTGQASILRFRPNR